MINLSFLLKPCGYFFLFSGLCIAIATVVGFLRFNNPFTQIHISTIFEMFGLPFFLIGIILLNISQGKYIVNFKLFFIFAIWYILSPIMSYSIIKIIYFYDKKISK